MVHLIRKDGKKCKKNSIKLHEKSTWPRWSPRSSDSSKTAICRLENCDGHRIQIHQSLRFHRIPLEGMSHQKFRLSHQHIEQHPQKNLVWWVKFPRKIARNDVSIWTTASLLKMMKIASSLWRKWSGSYSPISSNFEHQFPLEKPEYGNLRILKWSYF